jgi:methionine synthase I (cobalamin-dependent)
MLSRKPDYRMEHLVYEMNFQSARLAKEVAEEFTRKNPNKPRFVAGAIGPTTKLASMSPDVNDPGFRAVTYDQLYDAYFEQVRGLVDGGVDLLLIETITDTLNTKAAIAAIQDYFDQTGKSLPLMISGHDCRPKRAHTFRTNHRGILDFHCARAEFALGGLKLRTRLGTNAPLY